MSTSKPLVLIDQVARRLQMVVRWQIIEVAINLTVLDNTQVTEEWGRTDYFLITTPSSPNTFQHKTTK